MFEFIRYGLQLLVWLALVSAILRWAYRKVSPQTVRCVTPKTFAKHWNNQLPPPIVISQSEMNATFKKRFRYIEDPQFSSDSIFMLENISDYVDHLIANGCKRHELPPNADSACQIMYLAAQVSNGGFAQFTHNGAQIPWLDLDAIERGLKQIGEPYASSFSDYRKFLIEDAKGVPREAMPKPLQDFEQRFGLNSKALTTAAGEWIKKLPETFVARDDDYKLVLDQIVQAIPNREKRLRKLRREQSAAQLRDDRSIMCNLISARLNIPLIVVGGGSGFKKFAPDGLPGIEWYASSGDNVGALFYDDDRVIFCEKYYFDGARVKVTISGQVQLPDGQSKLPNHYAQDVAAAVGRNDVDPFTNNFTINREVIRLPRADVTESKKAACDFPVWDAIDFALRGQEPPDPCEQIFCGLKGERDGRPCWGWEFVCKSKNRLTIVDLGSEIEIVDTAGATIKRFSRSTLDKAIQAENWDAV